MDSQLLFLIILMTNVNFLKSLSYKTIIYVENNNCFNETCYDLIDDVANSPLVECSYL
jgi:hypothetical protein